LSEEGIMEKWKKRKRKKKEKKAANSI